MQKITYVDNGFLFCEDFTTESISGVAVALLFYLPMGRIED